MSSWPLSGVTAVLDVRHSTSAEIYSVLFADDRLAAGLNENALRWSQSHEEAT